MSGIEVAGLVLGAFPVIISALDSYRKAFTQLNGWWKFQRTFENFIDDVGTQRILFDNNLERLLSPFIDSETQMGLLLNDPYGPLWKQVDLEDNLRARLGQSYPFYRSIVTRIVDVLDNLQVELGIKNGQAIHLWETRKPGRMKLELEFRRLKISFSQRKFHHVELLSRYNSELKQLLQSSDELAPMRKQRRTAPNTLFLQQLQSHAVSLYETLNTAFTCTCQSPHPTHLLLEKRISEKSIVGENWKMLFPIKITNQAQPSFTEIEIIIKDEVNATAQATSNDSGSENNAIFKLKADIDQKSLDSKMSTVSIAAHNSTNSTMTTNMTPGLSPLVQKKAPKRVSFLDCHTSIFSASTSASATQTHSQTNIPSTPIDDMCAALESMNASTDCLGFVQDQQKRQHIFFPLKPCTTDHSITLEGALKPTLSQVPIKPMDRQIRFTIAVILASSVLQLHTSPWLTERWNKSDIFLHVNTSQQRVNPQPLLRAEFRSTTTATPLQPSVTAGMRFNTKRALSSLGIMLLELCFGKTIEEHPLRPQFFGPNNQPNAFTDISTAKEWHEDVLGELGEDISDVIRRCLDCSFAPKPNLGDKEFQEAVFDGVVLPLHDLLKVWEKN